jgi:hypothetical protein
MMPQDTDYRLVVELCRLLTVVYIPYSRRWRIAVSRSSYWYERTFRRQVVPTYLLPDLYSTPGERKGGGNKEIMTRPRASKRLWKKILRPPFHPYYQGTRNIVMMFILLKKLRTLRFYVLELERCTQCLFPTPPCPYNARTTRGENINNITSGSVG